MRACLECENFPLFLLFSYEIELIPVKFLRDSCEIHAFQTGPECLLTKWLFKLINEDSVWQELMKYLKDKTISEACWKPGYSHFWSGLMKIKDLVLHIGTSTRFWEHNWLGDYTLKQQFPSLYGYCQAETCNPLSSLFVVYL